MWVSLAEEGHQSQVLSPHTETSSKWKEPTCETRDTETARRHLDSVCVIEGGKDLLKIPLAQELGLSFEKWDFIKLCFLIQLKTKSREDANLRMVESLCQVHK